MQGRLFAVPYAGTVTSAGGNTDLLECLPGAAKPVWLRGFIISQFSEVGDAAEEALQLSIVRMTATVSSSNGTAVTPVPVPSAIGNTAATFTAECNGATVATTSGTTTICQYMAWNERNSPYDFFYPSQDFSWMAQNAEGLFFRQDSSAADDYSAALTFWVEEG